MAWGWLLGAYRLATMWLWGGSDVACMWLWVAFSQAMESTSQSLAGRSAVVYLLPLSRHEVVEFSHHPKTLNETLLAGGYGGTQRQERNGVTYLPWHAIQDYSWEE